ncbi:hypothetical protein PENSPDRAFT_349970 [Peniophora sp. CONT]|nr:hypothetical protein PENSPDRAFT_349970 [Peniophora sp. CONT]
MDFGKMVHEMELDPPLEERQMRLLEVMPLAAVGWRAGSANEIMVSGSALGLYAPAESAERAGAYWLPLREACEAELSVPKRFIGKEDIYRTKACTSRNAVTRRNGGRMASVVRGWLSSKKEEHGITAESRRKAPLRAI